jgi:hypothetical protein
MRWNASKAADNSPTSLHEVIRTLKSTDECCRLDTPLASSSNVSRSRPTTDPHGCFVTVQLMILRKRSAPRWAPAHFPTPSTRLGPRPLRRSHRSRAEGGTGLSRLDPNPPQGATRRGRRSRADVITRTATRRGHNARPIRHSVGRKVAINWNIAGVWQSGH